MNLRNRTVEWFSNPDRDARVYGGSGVASGSESLPVTSLGLQVAAEDLFPPLRQPSPAA